MSFGLTSFGLSSFGLSLTGAGGVKYALNVFPFSPDWSSDVVESFEWRTDIIEAFNKTEQRRGLRAVPIRRFEYSVMLTDSRARLLQDLIYGKGNELIALPVWTDVTRLQAPLGAGGLEIEANTANLSYSAPGYALLYSNPELYEIVRLEIIEPALLTLLTPANSSWPAGTKIYPLIFARVELMTKLRRKTAGVLTSAVGFRQVDVESNTNLQSAEGFTTFDGVEVFDTKHNWASEIDAEIQLNGSDVDYGRGATLRYVKGRHALKTRGFKVLLKDRADMQKFRAFVGRRLGRLKSCMVSTGAADFQLFKNELATSKSITVKGTSFGLFVSAATGFYAVEIKTEAGTIYREIESVSLSSTNSVLNFTAQLGQALNVAAVKRISLLDLSRLSADRVSISWKTAEVAESELFFTSMVKREFERGTTIAMILGQTTYRGAESEILNASYPLGLAQGDLVLAFQLSSRVMLGSDDFITAATGSQMVLAGKMYSGLEGLTSQFRLANTASDNDQQTVFLMGIRHAAVGSGTEWLGQNYDIRVEEFRGAGAIGGAKPSAVLPSIDAPFKNCTIFILVTGSALSPLSVSSTLAGDIPLFYANAGGANQIAIHLFAKRVPAIGPVGDITINSGIIGANISVSQVAVFFVLPI